MDTTTYSGDWKTDAHAMNGRKGHHSRLARDAEAKGFEVLADPDDNGKSWIARPGTDDFGDRVVGEIYGDDEAEIKITASLE